MRIAILGGFLGCFIECGAIVLAAESGMSAYHVLDLSVKVLIAIVILIAAVRD